jgi:hypothetical protein
MITIDHGVRCGAEQPFADRGTFASGGDWVVTRDQRVREIPSMSRLSLIGDAACGNHPRTLTMIKTLLLSIATAALLTTAAAAGPINATAIAPATISPVEQVRMNCDRAGRCWSSRGSRHMQRGYRDNGYAVRRGHDRRGYDHDRRGPSIGLSFGR